MTTWKDGRRRHRLAGASAAVAVQLALAAILFWGLTIHSEPLASGYALDAITVVDLPAPPDPPHPLPRPTSSVTAHSPEGAARPAAPEAPSPRPPLPVRPAPPGEAVDDNTDGQTGANGDGNVPGGAGVGSGTESGKGGGIAIPAQRISGALNDSDYPREAARQGLEGTVAIGFRVRTDGRIDRCTVLTSSGHELLDRLTCRLFTQRFRFRPAMTVNGHPVDSTLRTSFTWGTRQR